MTLGVAITLIIVGGLFLAAAWLMTRAEYRAAKEAEDVVAESMEEGEDRYATEGDKEFLERWTKAHGGGGGE